MIRFKDIAVALTLGAAVAVAVAGGAEKPAAKPVVNLLTDVSHDYSFNLSWASRNQNTIFRGFHCLTSLRSIHRADLEPVNAFVLLLRDRLPYAPKDAPHVLDYVRAGGGVYLCLREHGRYRDALNAFLKPFGLRTGDRRSDDPADWGICAHAPSELVFPIGGRYERFTAAGGLPGKRPRGSVGFRVRGDGKLLYESNVVTGKKRAAIDVDVAGVDRLTLVTTDGGNGKHADCSVWYDPRLVCGATRDRVLLEDAAAVTVGWARAAQDRHFNGTPLGSVGNKRTDNIITAADHPAAVPGATFKKSNRSVITPLVPGDWETVYAAGGSPAVFVRACGKGVIVVDTTARYHAAVGEDADAIKITRRIIEYLARNKTVEPVGGGGGWQGSTGYHWDRTRQTEDGLRIHFNDYTEMFVDSDVIAYKKTVAYLHRLTGLDAEMKASQIAAKKAMEDRLVAGQRIRVDIGGVDRLTLVTTDGGNGNGGDHSIWADARLIDAGGASVPLKLSDAVAVRAGYGRPVQDRHGTQPISIGGNTFDTGIYIHAPSTMTIPLKGKYAAFTAHVGCNDTHRGSVGFKVIGDGKTLWESPAVYRGGRPGGDPNTINHVPEGVIFRIRYLACRGSGFLLPQGAAVDLPPGLEKDWQVHLGMFAHEMGHAWSFPYCEKMGEESSAFIFNNLILHYHHGQDHRDSVTRRLAGYLRNKEIDDADLAKGGNNYKYYMFIDLMIREYGEGIWRNYNLLKYALLNKPGAAWNPHTTAWLWSIAAGEDVFPRFRTAFGSSVEKDRARLPEKAMAAGFDPEAVGRRYGVPLKKLPRLRRIFDGLKDFADVRAFYKKEIAEKGHPAVEG